MKESFYNKKDGTMNKEEVLLHLAEHPDNVLNVVNSLLEDIEILEQELVEAHSHIQTLELIRNGWVM